MFRFRPKQEPFLIQIFKSGLFQFMMVIALGAGVTWFVVRADRPQKWIQKINRFTYVTPNPQSKTEAGIAEDQVDLEAPPPPQGTLAKQSASATEIAAVDETTATSTVTANSISDRITAPVASATVRLKIQMIEIDHEYLSLIMNDRLGVRSLVSGDITTYKSNTSIKLNLNSARLLKADVMTFTEAKTQNISAGNRTRWLRLNITPQELNLNPKVFSASYTKNHPNDTQQIPLAFSLAVGEQLFISGTGLLNYFDLETDLANTPPFTIFNSGEYRNQKTTFAIIIELQ